MIQTVNKITKDNLSEILQACLDNAKFTIIK